MDTFGSKQEARDWVLAHLQENKQTRYPFRPQQRIPNFTGAVDAAQRLFDFNEIRDAKVIKCNPDSPQKPFREEALRRGITLLVPTPKLRDDFLLFDPQLIPKTGYKRASQSSHFLEFAQRIALKELPRVDATVVGCLAVTRGGKRCGKGHGYADLEAAILAEMGIPNAPVFTSVHEGQVVHGFPSQSHDLHLSGIATPQEAIRTPYKSEVAPSLRWELLTPERIREMPILLGLMATFDASESERTPLS